MCTLAYARRGKATETKLPIYYIKIKMKQPTDWFWIPGIPNNCWLDQWEDAKCTVCYTSVGCGE